MTVNVRAFTRNRFGRIESVSAHVRSDHGSGYSITEAQPVDMDAIRKRRQLTKDERILADKQAAKRYQRKPINWFNLST